MRRTYKRTQPNDPPAEAQGEPAAPAPPPVPVALGTGVYVDVENLRASGQQIVQVLLDTWPESIPRPKQLSLYVRADLVELWRLWATHQFRGLDITVKGVQHFSTHSAKNSADIAIATDAIADLLLGQVGYLAVVSDDSDFIGLYAAVRDRLDHIQTDLDRVPFMWVITDRNDTLSTTVRQYFPREAIFVVPFEETGPGSGSVGGGPRGGGSVSQSPFRPGGRGQRVPAAPAAPALEPAQPLPHPQTNETVHSENGDAHPDEALNAASAREIVDAIVEHLPLGTFKSTDCQVVIRRRWPKHPLASANGPAFGTEFLKSIWPLLEGRGARVLNPGRSPRRYEMTEVAKRPS